MRTLSSPAVIAVAVALALVAAIAPANYAQGRPVVIATSGDAETMDAVMSAISTTFSIQRHVLEPLVDNDPDAKLVPVLATQWRALDALTWEFKLRPNVRFHNGEPFTAEAAKFSIERARDHPKSLLKAYVSLIKEVRVVDDLTLRLVTTEPSPDLVANLAEDFQRSAFGIRDVPLYPSARGDPGAFVAASHCDDDIPRQVGKCLESLGHRFGQLDPALAHDQTRVRIDF